ncbi:SDR family oxidoreductase [Sphingobium sufflavum]|uniref:SDR family NAD(P)-dependent oxidoreductase n=1 Tax=Sphingobium sufflavum TaxID=1129547 RepID=UPI001F40A933|nr:SDR family NAD(P)-dependent oxidoreductase [Sphingobium sufflavum]MCE7797072.1 SDR family oxidoreductase [Sphingobium sufflavum]
MFEGRFRGRTAVITGGASGAGLAIARRLIDEGAQVALWDMDSLALQQAEQATGAALTIEVDVTQPQAVLDAATQTYAALGRIDLLLNSAGMTGPTLPALEYPQDAWRKVVDIHLNGTFYCCQAVVPHMLVNNYGRIVNMASVAGKEGNPNLSAYSAAKAGVIGFTKSFGKELATTGVLVNAVTPAVFRTPMLDQMPQSQIDYMVGKIPMGRLGEVEDVTALVCWLLSEECSFSTAATFDISGGRTTY